MDACLPKDEAGNFIAIQEKSDVVHDLLAFLAERMLEMNKQKQQEIRGFIGWLEGYLSAKVEDLTPKTKLQSYYELIDGGPAVRAHGRGDCDRRGQRDLQIAEPGHRHIEFHAPIERKPPGIQARPAGRAARINPRVSPRAKSHQKQSQERT